MKLERIEVRRLTLPLRTPFETSFGRTEVKQFLLVSPSAIGARKSRSTWSTVSLVSGR